MSGIISFLIGCAPRGALGRGYPAAYVVEIDCFNRPTF